MLFNLMGGLIIFCFVFAVIMYFLGDRDQLIPGQIILPEKEEILRRLNYLDLNVDESILKALYLEIARDAGEKHTRVSLLFRLFFSIEDVSHLGGFTEEVESYLKSGPTYLKLIEALVDDEDFVNKVRTDFEIHSKSVEVPNC